MVAFDDLQYTRDALVKQFLLVQLHGTDGSATDAGCGCIESKHTYTIEGLAEEGQTIATDKKEKEFYAQVSDLARHLRKEIETGSFNMHGLMRSTMKPYAGNPNSKALSSCIKKLEVKCCGGPTEDYSKCTCNPVAVCRASVGA